MGQSREGVCVGFRLEGVVHAPAKFLSQGSCIATIQDQHHSTFDRREAPDDENCVSDQRSLCLFLRVVSKVAHPSDSS